MKFHWITRGSNAYPSRKTARPELVDGLKQKLGDIQSTRLSMYQDNCQFIRLIYLKYVLSNMYYQISICRYENHIHSTDCQLSIYLRDNVLGYILLIVGIYWWETMNEDNQDNEDNEDNVMEVLRMLTQCDTFGGQSIHIYIIYTL